MKQLPGSKRIHRPAKYLFKQFACTVLLALSAISAHANVLSLSVNGSGQVAGGNNFCTSAGEPSCQIDYGGQDASITLTSTPNPGFQFDGWGGDCASSGTSPTCTVLVLGSSIPTPTVQNVSASFSAIINTATLTVALNGSGSGTITSGASTPGINCPGNCSQAYTLGTTVPLTATAGTADGSVFTGWQGGGCSGTGACNVRMISAQTVIATFEADSDGDGVIDPDDKCPNTPPGETVDADGCSLSQLDSDGDGVSDSLDSCPNTPLGERVDANGCSSSQLDTDGDGVTDNLDKCPNTPPGEQVDESGCSLSQIDSDGDGVNDNLDRCPDTPQGESVDANGCSSSQLDSDGDGVNDNLDQCPDTLPGREVDEQGCSISQRFGRDLSSLAGLNANERILAARIDDICPRLLEPDLNASLTKGQKDLRSACVRLKLQGTTDEQAVTALREISLRELASQKDYAIDMTTAHTRRLGSRLQQVNAGGGRGISVSGLNIGAGGEAIPAYVLQSAFEGLLGMGASGDSGNDFGKLGLYLQGDFDFGERDESSVESGYDFDAWNFALGADYRFTDSVFAGVSLGLGDAEVDYDANGGSSDITNWTVSTYGGWQINSHWFLDGLLSYSASEFETTRKLSYEDVGGSFSSEHRGDTDGEQIFVGINTGYMMNNGAWRFGPTASLTYMDGSIDSYRERSKDAGSEAWNFAVDKQEYESLRLSLGAQLDYIVNTSFGVIIPGIRAAYIAENEDGAERIALRLANNPFTEDELASSKISFTTDSQDSSFFDVSLNVSGQFIMGFSGFVSYQFYSAYDNYSQQGVSLGIRWDKPF